MIRIRTLARPLHALVLALAISGPAGAQAPAAYESLKKTLAVEPVLGTETTGGGLTADTLTALLTAALVRDGRFIVLERPGLAAVQAEQALAQGGATSVETAPRAGQLLGASAIVRATVTRYQPSAGSGGGLGTLKLGGLLGVVGSAVELRSDTASLEISLRLVDTTTGQVIATAAAEGSATSRSLGLDAVHTGNGLAAGTSFAQATPIGKAGEEAIAKAVELVAAGMRKVPWTAQVVEAAEGTVYVSAGADRNMQPGLALAVWRRGKVLTDPSTGVVLDVELRKVGTLRVAGVRERLSTALLESGEAPVRGDLVRLE